MTIISKPPTKEFSDGWERVFRKRPTRLPSKWGVVVGQPTKRQTYPDMKLVGKWCLCLKDAEMVVALFDSRDEARKYAADERAHNPYWRFHAKRYTA